MRHILLLAATILAFGAETGPNLSGQWRLVVERSDFARQPPPKSKVMRILHRDPQLTNSIEEETDKGKVSGQTRCTTDGKECVNQVMGNPLKAVATWRGKVLHMTTWGKFGANEIKLVDLYELSADGRTLTLRRHFEGTYGGVQDQVLVHQRVGR